MVGAYSLRRRLAPAALGLASILAAGCQDQLPTGVGADGTVPLRVTASVVGTPIATLVVTVTASDIGVPLVFNLTIANGTASGTIRVPPGVSRTIAATAMDDQGNVTHDGSLTLDVRPGQNPPVVVHMVPRSGQVPITITFGSYGVVVTPTTATIDVGAQVQLAVAVTDANGATVANPTVSWATSQPTMATVSGTGLVSGMSAGTATIVATYEGVAALSTVTVTGAALTVTIAGNGAGTVISSPAGISCSATCGAVFDVGTSVVLTATEASGSAFAGWSGGGCSGTGTCTTTVAAATTVTATFKVIFTLGNATKLPLQATTSPDYLLGNQIVVTSTVTLRQFGLITRAGGPQVKMALYTNVGGAPGSLLAQTAATTMVEGVMQMNSTAGFITLPAGTYWVMAIYSAAADGWSGTGGVEALRALPFASALPITFGTAQIFTAADKYNFYVVVD